MVCYSDAHAHIVENGFMMELPLAGSKSIEGEIQDNHSSHLDRISNPKIFA
jgi:hypothetical protein